jgi:hypothetical protein
MYNNLIDYTLTTFSVPEAIVQATSLLNGRGLPYIHIYIPSDLFFPTMPTRPPYPQRLPKNCGVRDKAKWGQTKAPQHHGIE